MRLPCLITLIHFFPRQLAALGFVDHPEQLLSLMFDIGWTDQADHFSGLCQLEQEAQKHNAIPCGDDLRLLFVSGKADFQKLFVDFMAAVIQEAGILMNEQKVIHISLIPFDPKAFLNKMIKLIQVANTRNLNHL